ncbi:MULTISPECIES: helix-turn-helix domain-containing protein [Lachnospiraceae]|uniref:DNA binding domain, excisionase family n=1 Tax=Dorea formicigenerans ATCC 27755 TaxID=411461 RepID=B0G6S0_9FIRM|nr:helix-turn-helix domain-containing protein [Mediterraneibacter gnavus]EDR46831.1 DNA binding domain, excisionase family [Dorea formicigenerans ATCC 27755]MDU2211428.1 helix-turn-helix domain-containing protein [Eubacterium sp.]
MNEASEYTGIGRNNLRKLITWQKIPVIRIGNKILILSEVLDQFLKKNEGHNLKNKYEVIAV